jgi:hypothetical protein
VPPPSGRLGDAYKLRLKAASFVRDLPLPHPAANGDEEGVPGHAACYSKGLPHDRLGQVDPAAYGFLRKALASGDPNDYESIPLGGQVKLANPQSALAYNLVGPDPSQLDLATPPRFATCTTSSPAATRPTRGRSRIRSTSSTRPQPLGEIDFFCGGS